MKEKSSLQEIATGSAGMELLEQKVELFDNPFDFEFNFCRGCEDEDTCSGTSCFMQG